MGELFCGFQAHKDTNAKGMSCTALSAYCQMPRRITVHFAPLLGNFQVFGQLTHKRPFHLSATLRKKRMRKDFITAFNVKTCD
jgi:hypothetical protein